MTVDVQDLRFVSFHFQELPDQPGCAVHIRDMTEIRLETQKVLLKIKAVDLFGGSCVFDTGIFLNQADDTVIVIATATGICQTDNFVACQLGQLQTILLYLSDHFCVLQLRQSGVGQRMGSNLVPFV